MYNKNLDPNEETLEHQVGVLTDDLKFIQDALHDCKRAIEFYDKVTAASEDERYAVGSDHIDWLESACRLAASFAEEAKPNTAWDEINAILKGTK